MLNRGEFRYVTDRQRALAAAPDQTFDPVCLGEPWEDPLPQDSWIVRFDPTEIDRWLASFSPPKPVRPQMGTCRKDRADLDQLIASAKRAVYTSGHGETITPSPTGKE